MKEKVSTTQLIGVFARTLSGQNFSPKTIRAYGDDLSQFAGWLQSVRVDWENPKRLGRTDVEGFLHHLSGRSLTGVSRARKLAAIRKFFTFLHEGGILQTNPAAAVRGTRREEKEPAILYKEQYKSILVPVGVRPSPCFCQERARLYPGLSPKLVRSPKTAKPRQFWSSMMTPTFGN